MHRANGLKAISRCKRVTIWRGYVALTYLRKNHKWGARRLAAPIRDVGVAGRRESFVEARYRCGFVETWLCEGSFGLLWLLTDEKSLLARSLK